MGKASQTTDSTWDKATKDAESELRAVEFQRSRLRRAIQIFRQNKKDGVPWPGDAFENVGTEG